MENYDYSQPYVTREEYLEVKGVDLAVEIQDDDNKSNKVNRFIQDITNFVLDHLVMEYRCNELNRQFNNFEDLAEFRRKRFHYGMLEEIEYVLNNGLIHLDSGINRETGTITDFSSVVIGPSALKQFKLGGFCNKQGSSTKSGLLSPREMPSIEELLLLVSRKVDKVDGKGLSTYDYNDAARNLLHTLSNESNNKVDKEEGKGLSTCNFSNAYKDKLDGIENGAQANVIEEIRLFNVPLTITGKAVNLDLSGYYYLKTETDSLLSDKEDKSNKVTSISSESTNTEYPSAKATHDAIKRALSNVYKWQGTMTVSQLNALVKDASMHGFVYNVADDGNLTVLIGGSEATVSVVEGDNVALVYTDSNNIYWDKLAGTFTVDLSDYYNKEQVDEAIANSLSYGGFNTISDANDAELNKFYWISSKTTNFPNNDSKVGLLMNMGYSSTYRTQVYILGYGSNAPKYYVRNIVGTSWTNWYELAREEGLLRNTRQSYDVGPNDADNAVNNTFICVVNKTTNYPYANASGFLYTNYSLADDKYGIQMFISRTSNDTYGRPTIYVRSKNNNVFYKWHKLAIDGNPTIQLSMFKSIAACGDSYTAGFSVDKDGTTREKAFQNSWVRTLARKNGIFGGIYAKSGITTSGWLTDSDCLLALQADSNHYELYVIFLGFNDSVSGFGTAEDIDLENPLNSANTSCGNFAKIKYYIEQKDPNAKIVICKLPYGGANTKEQVDAKNPLIEACATKLGVGCASIADFPSSNDNIYKQSNHGTKVGYSYLASAIEYGVCKALAMTYYVGFSYDSTENVNKNYNAFLENLYDNVSGNANGYIKADGKSELLNVINAFDISGGNTLTAEQYALIRNGKPTIIKGTFLSMLNPVLLTNSYLESFGMIIGANAAGNYTRVQYYEIYQSGDNYVIQIHSNKRIELRNIYDINGKEIPNSPNDTTKQYKIVQQVGGALAYVEDEVESITNLDRELELNNETGLTVYRREFRISKKGNRVCLWIYYSARNETGSAINRINIKQKSFTVSTDIAGSLKDMFGNLVSTSDNNKQISTIVQEIYNDGSVITQPMRFYHAGENKVGLYNGSNVSLANDGNLIIKVYEEFVII